VLTIAPKKPAVGFSLIELIIAIAIVGLVSAIAMPSYATWIKNSRVRTAAESIQNGLQIARAEAVKRNSFIEFQLVKVSSKPLNSEWKIISCTSATSCLTTLQNRKASEGSSAEVIVSVSPSASYKAVFNNLGSVSANPIPFTQLDISLSGADRPLRVKLGVGGNTRLCDPSTSLAASDPRRC
jgi:type IV fimbrial biogenesis protein FimT